MPISLARDRRRGRRGAAPALRRDHPGARAPASCRTRRARAPGGRAGRAARGSSTALAATRPVARRAPPAGRAAAPQLDRRAPAGACVDGADARGATRTPPSCDRQPASGPDAARPSRAIAERCPGSLEELGAVRGVGPMTLADVGEDVLATVRATVRRRPLVEPIGRSAETRRRNSSVIRLSRSCEAGPRVWATSLLRDRAERRGSEPERGWVH